jgi:hypothetical protein
VFVANSTIFNQGSFVLQPGSALSFGGASDRFDNIGDIRGNGGSTQIIGSNLTLNNSGTIRADSGTLTISSSITWESQDGTGSFYPFTTDAVINILSAFTVPGNTTAFFKGPGLVSTSGLVAVNGTLEVGVPASGATQIASVYPADGTPADPGNWLTKGNAIISGGGVVLVEDGSTMAVADASIQGNFAGLFKIKKGGTLNIKGSRNNGLDTFTQLSGTITLEDGSVLTTNIKEWDMRNTTVNLLPGSTMNTLAPLGIVSFGLPAPVFNNFGTWNAIGGTSSNPPVGFSGITANAPLFNNDGTLNVTGGPFQISGGTGSGIFKGDAGSEISFATNRYTLEAAHFAAKVRVYQFGELFFQRGASPGEVPDIPLLYCAVDGRLSKTVGLTITDFFLSGGTIDGPGDLNVPVGGTFTISGPNSKALAGGKINNSGTAIWTGTGNIEALNGAIWNNLTGSTFEIQNDALFNGSLSNTPTFNNLTGATFKKSAGTGTSTIGINFNNYGVVDLQSGTTNFYNFNQLGGSTLLNGGNFGTVGGTPIIFHSGSCGGNGNINGDLFIGTEVGEPDIIFSPGVSPGKIKVNGNYTQRANGTLRIEVAGLATPGVNYDQVEVTGAATLGGRLRVLDINGFTPSPSDTITPLIAGSITGVFSSTNAQVNYGNTSLTVAALPTPLSQLQNISTRMRVLTGENVLIGGFIITGSDPKKVIIRGIGPSLGTSGVQGALTDTTLELHQGSSTLAANDDWKEHEAEVTATTIPPKNDLESAIVITLDPGSYTAILAGKGGETGIGLVEVYDLAQAANSQAANISTRGFVDTGDNVMIGGLIAGPNNAASSRVLIRAIGPSLQSAGVGNPLQDPFLELHDSAGVTIATNDDWKSDQQIEIQATTIPPTNDQEAAILSTLAPGNYTAIVRGHNGTGVGLVEVYNLQ